MPRRATSRKSSRKKQSAKVSFAKPATGSGKYKVAKRFTGKGSYFDRPLESGGRYLGEKVGGWIGSKLGSVAGRITGTGDYMLPDGTQVLAPDPPMMVSDQYGTVITHREYLGDLISSSTAGGFSVQSYSINPGDIQSFPWLSSVCGENFQQYKFEQLMFEYRTFSSDALNSTNTSLGAVFSCVNYDYNDPDVTSRAEIENTDWARSVKPSQSMLIPVECDPKQTGLNAGLLYILNASTVPSGADPKTYYLGKMWIGSTGCQGTSVNLGSIYVSYRVRLMKPVMSRPLSSALAFTGARSGCTASIMFGNANSTTANTTYYCDSIGVSMSNNVLTMSKNRLLNGQKFIMYLQYDGASAASLTAPTITHSGGAGWNYFSGFGLPFAYAPYPAATGTTFLLVNVFTVTNDNQDLTITLGGSPVIPGAPCGVTIGIFQICGTPLENIGQVNWSGVY